MPDELISLNEYCRRYKKSYNTVKGMIARGEIKATRKGEKSHYLIRVGGDTVSREEYNKLMERCVKAETTVELMGKLLIERGK